MSVIGFFFPPCAIPEKNRIWFSGFTSQLCIAALLQATHRAYASTAAFRTCRRVRVRLHSGAAELCGSLEEADESFHSIFPCAKNKNQDD